MKQDDDFTQEKKNTNSNLDDNLGVLLESSYFDNKIVIESNDNGMLIIESFNSLISIFLSLFVISVSLVFFSLFRSMNPGSNSINNIMLLLAKWVGMIFFVIFIVLSILLLISELSILKIYFLRNFHLRKIKIVTDLPINKESISISITYYNHQKQETKEELRSSVTNKSIGNLFYNSIPLNHLNLHLDREIIIEYGDLEFTFRPIWYLFPKFLNLPKPGYLTLYVKTN